MQPLPGLLDAPINQPLVDLGTRPTPQAAREQAAAMVTCPLLNLPLLPDSQRRSHRCLSAPPGIARLVIAQHNDAERERPQNASLGAARTSVGPLIDVPKGGAISMTNW